MAAADEDDDAAADSTTELGLGLGLELGFAVGSCWPVLLLPPLPLAPLTWVWSA